MDFRGPAKRRARPRDTAGRPDRPAIVIDGLALGVLPEARRSLRVGIRCSRWCIIRWRWNRDCLPEQADALRRSERAALAAARDVIVTSAATARLVAADYGVPAERITVARPGSDPAPLARRQPDGVVRLLSVGAVVPRKGFDVLIAALATLADLAVAADDRRRPHARPECRRTARCRYRRSRTGKSRSPCSAPCRHSALRRSMRTPICSCSPRVSRATAWPMPRRSRMACR